MKAVILVGGRATRLEPLTINTPKAMVPVLNVPFLVHTINHLKAHGIEEIVLAQGHLAKPMESYLGDGKQYGVRINHVLEDSPRGTAGAIKNTESYIDGTFLVLNGDIFTDLDLTAMIKFHRKNKAVITIAVTPVEDPTAYGLIETDSSNLITRFLEKPKKEEITTNMINAGTYIIEPEILDRIPPQKQVSIERETFQQVLAQKLPMYAFASPAYWMDMGTPEKYLQLHRDLLSGKSKQYPLGNKGVVLGAGCKIHQTAKIIPPVIIGENCTIGARTTITGPVVIGDRSSIAEDCTIVDSVIWRDNQIGAKVQVKSSIIADSCCLNEAADCRQSVLGDKVVILSNCRLEPGSRISPGTTIK